MIKVTTVSFTNLPSWAQLAVGVAVAVAVVLMVAGIMRAPGEIEKTSSDSRSLRLVEGGVALLALTTVVVFVVCVVIPTIAAHMR